MNVGIAITTYNQSAADRAAVRYARGLAARSHSVSVFTQSVVREAADEKLRFVEVGGIRSRPALRLATFPIAATRTLAGEDLDNIVSFGCSIMRPAVVRLPGAHRSWWEVASREWPSSMSEALRQRLNPQHRLLLELEQRVLGAGLPTAVLAAGDWAAADIRRFYPAVSDRVEVVPDGVDLAEFSFDEHGRASLRDTWGVGDGPVLFTVATELRRKGLGTMFEAFRLVREELPGARLVVGGRAPAADIRALAAQHRVSRELRALGFVKDLRAAYSAADVLVYPTRFDPWGVPIIEALACGTPVAASSRAGAASEIIPGTSGVRIEEPQDPAVVAAATLEALELKADRDRLHASITHLAWDRIVDRIEQILEQKRP